MAFATKWKFIFGFMTLTDLAENCLLTAVYFSLVYQNHFMLNIRKIITPEVDIIESKENRF